MSRIGFRTTYSKSMEQNLLWLALVALRCGPAFLGVSMFLAEYTYLALGLCVTFVTSYVLYDIIRRDHYKRIDIGGRRSLSPDVTQFDEHEFFPGFGHDVAKHLHDTGYTVFAGCLQPDGEGARKLRSRSSRTLHIVPLDVTDENSVKDAWTYTSARLPVKGLWGIINNAGIGTFGDIEWCTMAQYRNLMDVNFLGAIRVLHYFLPLVRKSQGRIVLVSSVRGLYPAPVRSAYHATKHGVETLADTLRMEMKKFGVHVSVIEPGHFSGVVGYCIPEQMTRNRREMEAMWNTGSDEAKQLYRKQYLEEYYTYDEASNLKNSALTTWPVVRSMEDALTSKSPKTRYLVPGTNKIMNPEAEMARFYNVLPRCLSDRFILRRTNTPQRL